MTAGKTFVDHRIGTDGGIVTNFNRTEQFRSWSDIAIIPNPGYSSTATELGTDIDASMNSAVRSNSGARIHHNRAVVKNREPWTEHIDGNRKTQLD